MRAQIEQELQNFVVENFLFGEAETLSNEDSFLEKGIIDSTGILELVTYITKRYDIEILATELAPENFDSLVRLSNFVCRKLKDKEECRSCPGQSSSAEAISAQAVHLST
jgi:acyl carrier protein